MNRENDNSNDVFMMSDIDASPHFYSRNYELFLVNSYTIKCLILS